MTAVRDEPTPEGEMLGEVAIEREAIHIAIEETDVLISRLMEKLQPVLNLDAFKTEEGEGASAPLPDVCSLAADIRRDRLMIRGPINRKLAELLQFIEL